MESSQKDTPNVPKEQNNPETSVRSQRNSEQMALTPNSNLKPLQRFSFVFIHPAILATQSLGSLGPSFLIPGPLSPTSLRAPFSPDALAEFSLYLQ